MDKWSKGSMPGKGDASCKPGPDEAEKGMPAKLDKDDQKASPGDRKKLVDALKKFGR